MKVVLLANGWVGWKVAQFLKQRHEEIVGLVIHQPESRRDGEKILEALSLSQNDPRVSTETTGEGFKKLELWQPDILVSAWYGYILRREVLEIPSFGCLNLHPSYLPYNRGKFPNVWSIVERVPAGVSVHYMDEGIDSGDLIARRQVQIDPTDTGETLYRKLESECVDLFSEVWPLVKEGKAARMSQSDLPEGPTFHKSNDVTKIDHIDLERAYPAGELIDILRARTFPPHPAAYFESSGKKIYVRVVLTEADE